MARTMSREQRRAAFMQAAGEMYDALEDWYDQHPQASFGEIEQRARHERRKLMSQGLEVLVNGRDTGFQLEAPACPKCGQAMRFEGYRGWDVHGLEGDTCLTRAYYVCSQGCGETIFPPQPQAAVEERPLE